MVSRHMWIQRIYKLHTKLNKVKHQYCRMWRRVVWQIFTEVLEKLAAFIFKLVVGRAAKTGMLPIHWWPYTKLHGVTSNDLVVVTFTAANTTIRSIPNWCEEFLLQAIKTKFLKKCLSIINSHNEMWPGTDIHTHRTEQNKDRGTDPFGARCT